MKIQDVLEGNSSTESYEYQSVVLKRHNELLKEIKEKQNLKVYKEQGEQKAEQKKQAMEGDVKSYVESVERIRAAAIAEAVARGQDIAKSQEEFLQTKYPDMLSNATIIKNRIQNVLKRIDSSRDRTEAETELQKADSQLLSMPYGEEKQQTVFDVAIKLANEKK